MKASDWIALLTALGVLLPVIIGGIIKIIQAIESAHGTAAKAVAAAETAGQTALAATAAIESLRGAMKPPSNAVSNGAVTENTNVALHYFVDMLAAVLKVPAPALPTPSQTANKEAGATLDSLPITTSVPRSLPSTITPDHPEPTQ